MQAVIEQEEELTEFAEDVGIPLNGCAIGLEEESPQVRKDRILAIRRQLAEGTYDLDERLDAILDRLLAAVCI
jgi:anti-sigma28 factor (negative regulator of flagellin synthesis)